MAEGLPFMDSHPMSWTPNDLVNTQDSAGLAQHVTQIGEPGVSEVEYALKKFKGW
jgi:predicted transport protein